MYHHGPPPLLPFPSPRDLPYRYRRTLSPPLDLTVRSATIQAYAAKDNQIGLKLVLFYSSPRRHYYPVNENKKYLSALEAT